MIRGIVKWVEADDNPSVASSTAGQKAQIAQTTPRRVLLVREAMGEALRELRLEQRKTLRDVSSKAQVALGYLSEVERAHKEASSEVVASICEALDIPLSDFLRTVSDKIAASEPSVVPDTIPHEMVDRVFTAAGSAR
jgi:hypothetical protein